MRRPSRMTMAFFPTEAIKVISKASFIEQGGLRSGCMPMGDDPLGLNPKHEI